MVTTQDQAILLFRSSIGLSGALFALSASFKTFRIFRGPRVQPNDIALHEALEDTSNTATRIYGFSLTAAAAAFPNMAWIQVLCLFCICTLWWTLRQKNQLVALYHFDKFVSNNTSPPRVELELLKIFRERHPIQGKRAQSALRIRNAQARRLAQKELKWQKRLSKDRPAKKDAV